MTFGRVAGPLPISEEADAQTVILPIYPDLAIDDQRYVIDCVRDALTRLVARDAR
jgi:dTDP-4-amino-4,6-dideoxygalactose transaminase